MCSFHLLITFIYLIYTAAGHTTKYEPTWDSLDSRPLPQWYDDAKVGIFIHWGVFSVPSFHSEWFWHYWKGDVKEDVVQFVENNYPPGWTYQDFAPDFTAQFYDPEQWTELFQAAGAKYVVLTSKHHEGYTLWPSKSSFSWNSMDVGPHLDLVGGLAQAIRKTDIKFGLYHSLYEWFNPLWIQDRDGHFNTTDFVTFKTLPELYELVNLYEPEVVWSDGEMEAPDSYWRAKEFLAWLYNDSPVRDTVVTNDRWGNGTACEHGDFYNCADRYSPGVLQPHKWENCISIDKSSWGFRRNAQVGDMLSMEEILQELTKTVSCGGNLLINVGPTKDGIISPIFEERLRQLGSWLQVNGEGIYESQPWTYQNDTLTPDVWYTRKEDTVYAFVWNWPDSNVLTLHEPNLGEDSTVTLLSMKEELEWNIMGDNLIIGFPDRHLVQSQWVFVLKITKVIN